jgi:hypothetical protein
MVMPCLILMLAVGLCCKVLETVLLRDALDREEMLQFSNATTADSKKRLFGIEDYYKNDNADENTINVTVLINILFPILGMLVLKSMRKALGTGDFYRVRIGIGRPPGRQDPADFVLSGYQADFETGTTYSGILYEEKARGILAQRGQQVTLTSSADPTKPTITVTGETGKSADIQAAIKQGDWNDYKIIAKGGHLQHYINGKLAVDVKDETKEGAKAGVLGLQLHAGPPMTVQFKNLAMKR